MTDSTDSTDWAGDTDLAALRALGWKARFAQAFESWQEEHGSKAAEGRFVPARVISEDRAGYRVRRDLSETGELRARASGRLRRHGDGVDDRPAVGDWVVLELPAGPHDRATIQAVLPRQGAFVRKAAGNRTQEQVVAANVDTVFLVTALDGDLSPRRLERYLTVAWESGAQPVVLLTKADLIDDPEAAVAGLESVALGTPIHPVSVIGDACDEALTIVRSHLRPGATHALLGSSGVGKSTLINHLLGSEVQRIRTVRERDQRGQHTTTHRELFVLPGGALVIDTPGMRELQLWEADEGLAVAFEDIDELAAGCRFRDCSHQGEPGCAVEQAIADGDLDPARLASFQKLVAEQEHLASRIDERVRQNRKQADKALHKEIRRIYKDRDR